MRASSPAPVEARSRFAEDFERLDRSVGADLPSWVAPLRRAAFSRWTERGFPTRRDEEWRFTNVAPIERVPLALAAPGIDGVTPEQIAAFGFGEGVGISLVFVNGRYAPELSPLSGRLSPLPEGVTVTSLAEALRNHPALVEPHLGRYAGVEQIPFTALNTAFLEDGAFVHLHRDAVLDEPIHLLFLSTAKDGEPIVSHPRTLLVADENSRATIVESYAGTGGAYFTNAVTEVFTASGAAVDHYKINREAAGAFHIANMQVRLAGDSVFSSQAITLGEAAIVRNDVGATLGGENIECTLNGVYLATGTQLVDNHTAIDHAMPHCDSHEVYKGILDGHGRGVFNGKIFVRQDAQKTDAKQTNQTLLLSDDAQINTKPQLEIYADDVRCTHGATVGQLQEDQLFYLRSRGLGKDEARALLIFAFAEDIIDRIKVESVRARLQEFLFARLAQAHIGEHAGHEEAGDHDD